METMTQPMCALLRSYSNHYFTRRKLEFTTTTSDEGNVAQFEFPKVGDAKECMDSVDKLISNFLKELTGHTTISLKSPKGPAQSVSFEPPFPNKPLMKFLEDAMTSKFPQREWGEQSNVGALLEHMYCKCLDRYISPTWVTEFPSVMCKFKLGASKRTDLVINGQPVVSIYMKTTGAVLILQAYNLAAIFGELQDLQSISSSLPKAWSKLHEYSLSDVPEVLEQVKDSMKKIWNNGWKRQQKKMDYLMKVVGTRLCSHIHASIADVWRTDFHQIRSELESSLAICEKWMKITEELTCSIWEGEWEANNNYQDLFLLNTSRRLEEVLNLRCTQEQLCALLGEAELKEIDVDSIWTSFAKLDPLYYNPYQDAEWEHAVESFQKKLKPVESRLALKLKAQLDNCNNNPFLLMQTFQKYEVLLTRKETSGELSTSRNSMLQILGFLLEQLSSTFNKKDDYVKTRALPGVRRSVNMVAWAHQQIFKLEELRQAAISVVAGSQHIERVADDDPLKPTLTKFLTSCDSLREKIKDYKSSGFQEWESVIKLMMKESTDPIAVTLNGNLLKDARKTDDTGEGKLTVEFPSQWESFMREVRHLHANGVEVAVDYVVQLTKCTKFYRAYHNIRHICNAYNTMESQILKCHRLLLVDFSNGIESQVTRKDKEGKVFSTKLFGWNGTSELEVFVQQSTKFCAQLSSENRKLRKVHADFTERVTTLMSTDLLHQLEKWKNVLNDLRTTFTRMTRADNKTGMLQWKRHWEYQIYKAMEHQYQLGLETLNENLPDLECELIFKGQMLQFKPPLEQLRATYFQTMKDFINVPTKCKGVESDYAHIFAMMPDRNYDGISSVYQNAEALFTKLGRLRRHFKDWVILGTVDLENFVFDHLTHPQQWIQTYEIAKEKEKQLDRIEKTIRVDCVVVSTGPLRAAIADQLQRLFSCLQGALTKKQNQLIRQIDQYVANANEKLSARPTTLEEIGQANKSFDDISKSKEHIGTKYGELCALNGTLRQMNFPATDLGGIQAKWERFGDILVSHQHMIDGQLTKMRQSMEANKIKFLKDVQRYQARWEECKPKDISNYKTKDEIMKNCVEPMKELRSQLQELRSSQQSITTQCEYFNIAPPDSNSIDDAEAELIMEEEVWSAYEEFHTSLGELCKEDWLVFRSTKYNLDEWCKETKEKLYGKESSSVKTHLVGLVEEISDFYTHTDYLVGNGYTSDHWAALCKLLELKGLTSDKLTVGHFVERARLVIDRHEELRELHKRAAGEIVIRQALADLRTWGNDCCFQLLVKHERGRSVPLVKDWKELLTQVGDNQSMLSSMKDMPYYSNFIDEAQAWETKLVTLDQWLPFMSQIQRKWVYLEPIFSRGALPQEQGRFKKVDKEFVQIMKDIEQDKRLVTITKKTDLGQKLPQLLDQLDRCQKALNEYLELKRDKFPRFYFISDDDLLEILGQSQNPEIILAHLKKLFAGIASVKFNDAKTHITAMISAAGEVVPLCQAVEIKPEVEAWLNDLDLLMKQTLKQMLTECCVTFNVDKFPSQILCLSEYIAFTTKCEKAIKEGTVAQLKQELLDKLGKFTLIESVTKIVQLKMKALILDLIHNIDVCDQLTTSKCKALEEWVWQKQLRFYLDEYQACVIHMVDAKFEYTYEYQGNALKLVHTPLTDKCYLTLTQGMRLGYGGNPYGPAGTGKTESVKALGNAMGRQVLVFNCDEGIDFKSMGRIFTGIIKCGAWGCFDEFNRLKPDQLSAVSDMIQVIQAGLKNLDKNVWLLGKEINLNHSSGIFVTLNPAGKGYGGRSQLPDNLKQLFRAVAMSVPDIELIAETELYSEGFAEAKVVGTKLVEVFKLGKQLLSQQQHYDWGLRALKAILRTAGAQLFQIRREEQKLPNPPKRSKEEQLQLETEIVVKSACVNTLSKLTFDDTKRFNELLQDIFPGVKGSAGSQEKLVDKITESMKELKLQVLENQINKILQLNEAMSQRMGVVIVGPSGSGKSTLLKVLRKAYSKMGDKIPMHVMNPKAMPRQQLLGHMDMDTREWSDGILTVAAKKVVEEPLSVRSWILCDGDIDPEWVESLNSVLDDNRLLTMPNGVRIQFGDNVNFMFETHSLAFASPATVSRMGMIFLSEEDVTPQSVVSSWLTSLPEEQAGLLSPWMSKYFYTAVESLCASKSIVVETTKMGIITSGLSHLAAAKTKPDFCLGLIRGLGSYLQKDLRQQFVLDTFKLCEEKPSDMRKPLDVYYENGEYMVYKPVLDTRLTINHITSNFMVQTVDVQRTLDTIRPWVEAGKPFILVGPEGCGKSMVVTNVCNLLRGVKLTVINCSSQTSAQHVITKLNQACGLFSTNTGRVLRPKDCDRLILFLKDLNLPKPDQYATTQLHAFMQQLILYEGFYDHNLEWIGIERVQIVGSMNPQGGIGRYPLATRFTALCCVLYMNYPDKEQLTQVYQCYMSGLLESSLCENVSIPSEVVDKIAPALVQVYEDVKLRYNQDDQSHYIFTPRDITGWVKNLLTYDLSSNDLLDVISYEGQRIFSDRLASQDHRKAFRRKMFGSSIFKDSKETENFYVSFLSVASKKEESEGGEKGEGDMPDADEGKSKKDKKGKDKKKTTAKGGSQRKLTLVNKETLVKGLQKGIVTFSRENRQLDLALMDETLMWCSRVDRVLSQPGGSLLLAGRAGVGRRDIASLMAALLRMQVLTLNMTKDYSMKQFKVDLKSALAIAGQQNEEVLLVVEDHNLVQPEFLEMINSLLASGEVPGLYTPEELNALLGPLTEEAQSEGFVGGTFAFFANRLQKRLHVALVFDPTSHDYQLRCQSNPAIFTRCSVMWIDTWTQQSMETIPKYILEDIVKKLALDEAHGNEEAAKKILPKKEEEICKLLVYFHNSIGPRATPKNYVNFLNMYSVTYKKTQKSVSENRDRLWSGLRKLREAEKNVDELKTKAEEQKVKLGAKQEQADRALEDIQAAMERASEQKTIAEESEKTLESNKKEMTKKKEEVNKSLSHIQPLLDQAKEAVGTINTKDLQEVRNFPSPPEAVKDVLKGVLALFENKDHTWVAMKNFLGKRGFVNEILEFKADTISKEVREEVKKIIKGAENSYKEDVIKRASKATAPLATWVIANIEYSEVVEKIEPLRNSLQKLEESLHVSEEQLKKTKDEITKLNDSVSELKKKFKKLTAETEKLRLDLETAEGTLVAAEELLGKLGGEKDRWEGQVAELDKRLGELPSLSLISAAYMTYMAGGAEDVRRSMVAEWMKGVKIGAFLFKDFMRPESLQLTYKAEGLPADELSMDNGICILEALQTPLVIDPAQQALKWLKTHFENLKINVEQTSTADERFTNTLELAVRFGKTLIIAEVDKVEPVLYPLLRKDLMISGPKKTVQVGEKQIDFNENFKLFLFTRNPSLLLPPDAKSLVTEVNFAITRSGLEGQLLGVTLQFERPELEQQKSKLLQEEEMLKVQLAELEDSLLKQLAQSEGSLLENKTLIDNLNQIKAKSIVVKKSLEESKLLQADLDGQRDVYRPFARIGSVLYFLLQDLRTLDHMYQFALSVFNRLFLQSLQENKASSEEAVKKVTALGKTLIHLVFLYTSRSLFKQDRLLLALFMCYHLYSDKFPVKEWEYFMAAASFTAQPADSSTPSWVDIELLGPYQGLKATLPDLFAKLDITNSAWVQWVKSATPEKSLPLDLSSKLTPFQQLIIVQTLRLDRLPHAAELFSCALLEFESLTPPTVSLKDVHRLETLNTEPIIMITTPGADPSQEWAETASAVVGHGKFTQLAMGGGQTEEAITLLKHAAQSGEWLLLKNLHLVVSWIDQLEKEFTALRDPHEQFRLWLTSEPHPQFPAILLRSSLKITFESPPGIKKNLMRTYSLWSDSMISHCSPLHARLLFAVAWFHAVVQERRSYIPQGWVKFYEFSLADLRSAADVVAANIQGRELPQWTTIYGVFENAIYGGRMDNDFDVRILQTYMEMYFTTEMIKNQGSILHPGLAFPMSNKHADFVNAVSVLPDSDSPSLFHLSPNADRTVQKLRSKRLVDSLSRLQQVASSGSGQFNRDQWAARLKMYFTLWGTLCEQHKQIFDEATPPKTETPVSLFFYAETQTALMLANTIKSTVESLQKVIEGSALLTTKLHNLASTIMSNEVPLDWDKMWEGPESLNMWTRYVVQRCVALRSYVSEGPNVLQKAVRFDHMFRPSTFLNALRQETARKSNQPLGTLSLDCTWGSAKVAGATLEVVVEGILVSGCSVDEQCKMHDMQSDSPSLMPCPALHIAWVKQAAGNESRISIPCYMNSSRDKLLVPLYCPVSGPPERVERILQGTAFIVEQ